MAMLASEVSHDHGIMREVYEVTRQYAEVVQRMQSVGTDQDVISEDFFQSAVRLYADTLLDPDTLAKLSDHDRREALCHLATLALRWARKVRIG
jgi:hypothetical protein